MRTVFPLCILLVAVCGLITALPVPDEGSETAVLVVSPETNENEIDDSPEVVKPTPSHEEAESEDPEAEVPPTEKTQEEAPVKQETQQQEPDQGEDVVCEDEEVKEDSRVELLPADEQISTGEPKVDLESSPMVEVHYEVMLHNLSVMLDRLKEAWERLPSPVDMHHQLVTSA